MNRKIQNLQRKRVAIGLPQASSFDIMANSAIDKLIVPDGVETEIIRVDGYGIANARNKIRQVVLDNNLDYVFFIDSDIIVPNNILAKLLALDADIATGIYVKKAMPTVTELYNWSLDKTKIVPVLLAEMSTIKNPVELAACGFGATLIKRQVLEKIRFKWEEVASFNSNATTYESEDLQFCVDARKYDFKIVVDPELLCGHIHKVILPQQNNKQG